MPAIAITDYYSLYGALEFYQKAIKADIQPIIGVELALVHDISIKSGAFDSLWCITVLANNRDWYQALIKLVSEASTTWYHHKPRLDRTLLSKYWTDLTVLIGGEHSLIASQIAKNYEDDTMVTDLVDRLAQTMWGDIILEYCVQDYDLIPIAREINTLTMALASQWWYMLTCANNYHYIMSDEQEPFEIALAIRDHKLYQDRDRRKVVWQYHIMTEDEIKTIMTTHGLAASQIDMMIQNTVDCADKLIIDMPPLPAMFPSYDPPERIAKLYEQSKDTLIIWQKTTE